MKNKGYLIINGILLIGLASCQIGKKPSYSFSYKKDLATFDRNGDILATEVEATEDVTIKADGYELANKIDKGEDIFLILSTTTCGHCVKFSPKFSGFAKDSLTYIYQDNMYYGPGSLYNLAHYKYPDSNLEKVFDFNNLGTPSIFFIKTKISYEEKDGETIRVAHPSMKYIDFYDHADNKDKLGNYLSPLYGRTSVYRFSTYDGFEAYKEKHPEGSYFIYDEDNDASVDFFIKNLREISRKNKKELVLLDWASINSDDRAKFSNDLGFSYKCIQMIEEKVETYDLVLGSYGLEENQTIKYLEDEEDAIDYIASWYSNNN